jgi:hypothetical protein
MTDSKTKAARRLMASGTPPKEVAHSLRRIGPHIVSLGAGLFTDVKGRAAGGGCPDGTSAHLLSRLEVLRHPRQSSRVLLHSAVRGLTAEESAEKNPKSVGGEAGSTRLIKARE